MTLAIVLVSFIIVLCLIMFASIWFVNFMTRRLVASKHHDLEEITESGCLPKHWSTPYVTKIKKLGEDNNSEQKIRKIRRKAKRASVRRLNKLIQYIKNTRLVDDESTRLQLLEQLRQVRQQEIEANLDGL